MHARGAQGVVRVAERVLKQFPQAKRVARVDHGRGRGQRPAGQARLTGELPLIDTPGRGYREQETRNGHRVNRTGLV